VFDHPVPESYAEEAATLNRSAARNLERMASERADVMSDELRSWVEKKADETDSRPEAVLARAVKAYRFLEGEDETLSAAPDPDGELDADAEGDAAAELTTIGNRLDEVERRVESLQRTGAEDTHELDRLRERVDDLAGGVEEVAPADHAHPELSDRASEAAERAATAREELASLRDRVDEGFANFEEVLEYLTETTDETDEKLTRLARHLVRLREDVREVQSAAAGRAAAAELQAEANRHGESHARCGSCDGTVGLALLSTPRCPHCEAAFDGFEPGSGLFSSARLTVGERPALEGETADPAAAEGAVGDGRTLGDLFDDEDDGEDGAK
jgi:uncharacterized coiled-coil protein SlyX